MIGTLTRDMSTSLVAVGENVQSSEYVYDHMGRLMTGSIEFVGKVGNTYAVSTSYNKVGGLESKVSSPDASAQVFAGTSQAMTYDLTYQYSGTKPHQLTEVISSQGVPYAMSFAYNASGSISEITDLVGVDHSSYYWGQEQWLCGVENTQGIHHYVYDHAGERIMKSSITQTTVQLNDETINTVTTLEPYTLYVNPYYVVTSFSNADQRSKHYYMGTQRVATDIGVDYGVSPSPEQTESARGGNAMTVGETTQGLETDQVPFQSLGYKQDLERVLLGLSGEIGVEDLSEALVPIERFYPDLSAGVNSGEGIESEPPVYIGTRIMYWYHPDYVSNVDMVTDRSGEAYELFLYNAWGESLHHWSSSSTNSWSSPYRLNSKELDSETGMHYYGARYYESKLSSWISVDHKAQVTMQQYQFTGNNPVILKDPDGNDFGLTVNTENKTIMIVANVYTNNRLSYEQAKAGAAEWASKTTKSNGYAVTVVINVVEPAEFTQQDVISAYGAVNFYKNNGKLNKRLYNKYAAAYSNFLMTHQALADPIGNSYGGANGNRSEIVDGNRFIGGVTANGKDISMNRHTNYGDQGDNSKIVAHEFGHLLGLDDNGGTYYPGEGSVMEYSNPMYSPGVADINMILDYSGLFTGSKNEYVPITYVLPSLELPMSIEEIKGL